MRQNASSRPEISGQVSARIEKKEKPKKGACLQKPLATLLTVDSRCLQPHRNQSKWTFHQPGLAVVSPQESPSHTPLSPCAGHFAGLPPQHMLGEGPFCWRICCHLPKIPQKNLCHPSTTQDPRSLVWGVAEGVHGREPLMKTQIVMRYQQSSNPLRAPIRGDHYGRPFGPPPK